MAIAWLYRQFRVDQTKPWDPRLAMMLMPLYALLYPWVQPTVRAALAMTILSLIISPIGLGRKWHSGLWALLMVSLPAIATINFFLGYPMRVASGELAVTLLRLSGLHVERTGTLLSWGGQDIAIDAPCSGVRMLWVCTYVGALLACWFNLRPVKTFSLLAISLGAVIILNAFRSSGLFYLETGMVRFGAWAHPAVGLVSLVPALIVIGYFANRFRTEAKP